MTASRTTKPVSLKLDPDTIATLASLAKTRQRTPHWLMRQAVEEYVQREQKREAFNQATTAAWDEFQANGLHVTVRDADAWLQELEAGNDVEPPACRA